LVLDEPTPEDWITDVEEISFYIDPESQEHLHMQLKLDYSPSFGFKLITPEEILAYRLRINRTKNGLGS
jgi:hypothetical protein